MLTYFPIKRTQPNPEDLRLQPIRESDIEALPD